MVRTVKIFSLVCLIVVCPSFLPAQNQDSSGTAKKLLRLSLKDLMNVEVVTASRKAEKYSEAPANVIIVTSDMIKRRGYMNLTEVFEDLPGFDFTSKVPAANIHHRLFSEDLLMPDKQNF